MTSSADDGRVRVALFAGGRGSATIAAALAAMSQVDLTVILNAYDDGLSTGRIRALVPGMLGPSDVRKNFSNLLPLLGSRGRALAGLFEQRLTATDLDRVPGRTGRPCWPLTELLERSEHELTVLEASRIRVWLAHAMTHLQQQIPESRLFRELEGMSVGNLIFCGTYLENSSSFNQTIAAWQDIFRIPAGIVNVTDGSHRVLVGLKEDGTILDSEVRIVEQQSKDRIRRVFILPDYLTGEEITELGDLDVQDRYERLRGLESLPVMSPEAREALSRADVISYGPGTQHSSLLPSYMTVGVGDLIASRHGVEKVFIGNLDADHDIQSESINSLLAKVAESLNAGSAGTYETADLVTRCMVSTHQSSATPWGFESVDDGQSVVGVMAGQWSMSSRMHDGPRVARGILSLRPQKPSSRSSSDLLSVSIVVPVLDEARTLPSVLSELLLHDWVDAGIIPEFVVVDGGSVDGSWEILHGYPTLTKIRLERGSGRGLALRTGVLTSSGNFVVSFPSDGEYGIDAVTQVARALASGDAPVVFGSRLGMCANTDARLRVIYGGRTRAYYLSKWGGTILILAAGLLHKRWISDPLTGVKGFSRTAIRQLSMLGDGVDWDMQVIADAARLEMPLSEVPVHFSPRSIKEGKKIRPRDGLQALWRLVRPERRRAS